MPTVSFQGKVGSAFGKVRTTVVSSDAMTERSRKRPASGEARSGLRMESNVKRTSSAVTGTPSWKRTSPRRGDGERLSVLGPGIAFSEVGDRLEPVESEQSRIDEPDESLSASFAGASGLR